MEVSGLVRELLKKRGIESDDAVAAFLSPDYAAHTHDPFLLQDMEKALERLFMAMEKEERIAVYADFDCDGIPGAALLADFFAKIGYENVETYLPHRDREGYGFHTDAIEKLAQRGVKLIITVDVGTTAVDAVAFAASKGVDVIVTDHHEIVGELPECVALLNPKLGAYPFPSLCGAGVAFKLVQAASALGRRRQLPAFVSMQEGWEKWLLDLVALATVADMVPLVGENRALVHWGLQVLRKSPRPGIRALCAATRLRQTEIREDDIGFSLAPRINAASRMDDPELAFRLLTTRDMHEAEQIAAQLESLNSKRKGLVAAIVKDARKKVAERFTNGERIVVVGNTAWKPALLGLAANSIMGDRGGVVCLWGRDVNGTLKGSCRSDGEISIADMFSAARGAFVECGGHDASGGFTVSHEKVHELQEILSGVGLGPAPQRDERNADATVTLREISWPLLNDIARLAPFGAGNPKPLFLVSRATITSLKRFGKESQHVEISLVSPESAYPLRAFDFFRAPEQFTHLPCVGAQANILATIERDSFRRSLALRLVDVLPA